MPKQKGPDLSERRPDGLSYFAAVVMLLTVLIQAGLTSRVRFLGASPNLVLVVVVTWSLLRGVDEGMWWGFGCGLLLDLVAGMPIGTSSLALLVVSLLPGLGEGSLFQGNVFLPAITVAAASPLYGLIVLLTQQIRGVPVDWGVAVVNIIIPETVLNVVLVNGAYLLLRLLTGRLWTNRMGW